MLANLQGLPRKWGSFPFLLSLTLIATDWRGETFSFLFFFTTEISYLIIGLWHLLEPIPLWRENSLCAAQLKLLQFVNLPLPVLGPLGEKPDVQWVTYIPCVLEDRPQGEGEQSHATVFNKHQNKEWIQPWHFTMVIWYVDTSVVFRILPGGFLFTQILAVLNHLGLVQ